MQNQRELQAITESIGGESEKQFTLKNVIDHVENSLMEDHVRDQFLQEQKEFLEEKKLKWTEKKAKEKAKVSKEGNEGGRGILLMDYFSDTLQVSSDNKNTTVTMTFSL